MLPDTSENEDIYQLTHLLSNCLPDGSLSRKSMIIPKMSLQVESKLQVKSQHIDFSVKYSVYVMRLSRRFE